MEGAEKELHKHVSTKEQIIGLFNFIDINIYIRKSFSIVRKIIKYIQNVSK